MSIFLIILLGLSLGSFINALVYRLHEQRKKTIKGDPKGNLSILNGRSMCVNCKHQLAWYDLLPVVSWLMLKGKCRYCKTPISPRYPFVELFTCLVFIFSYLAWPAHISGVIWLQFALWLMLLTLLIALAVYDLKYMLLPNRLVFLAAIPVLLWVLVDALVVERNISPVLSAGYGLLAFGGLFYVLYAFSKGKWIGGGDVKLGYVLGAWLASPLLSLLAIFLASMLGTAVVIGMSSQGRVSRNTKLPFGPLLIAGFFIAFLFGEQLMILYSNLIF